ncbi:GIY-YIG nuclease family protein [Robertkochia flava]|uniref:GIY-YIG nuclease family protein n=1 Tax=Robertkochia flava TaxID=3447986 RepID=UPI001CCC0ED5|nr:GIY-YIG nuclease family protein [Robertkochia marina]
MVFVYVLISQLDSRLYVGLSMDVEKRLHDHKNGRVRSTKPFRPWSLIHTESYPDRLSARAREKYLKSGYGKMWLKNKYLNQK